jgi:hypothetical protein
MPIARMREGHAGADALAEAGPGYRFAHPGYGVRATFPHPLEMAGGIV